MMKHIHDSLFRNLLAAFLAKNRPPRRLLFILWSFKLVAMEGYQAVPSDGPQLPVAAVSCFIFARRFPLAWLRAAETEVRCVFEAEEAAKRQLASLLDIKVGQLKFANGAQFRSHFKMHSRLELASLPRQVIVLIHGDLRRLKADEEILLYHGAKAHRTRWFGRTLSACLLTGSPLQNNIQFLEYLSK